MRIERTDWDGGDAPAFASRLRGMAPALGELTAEVERIVDRVRSGGDAGLREVAEGLGEAVPESFRVDPEAVAAAPSLPTVLPGIPSPAPAVGALPWLAVLLLGVAVVPSPQD